MTVSKATLQSTLQTIFAETIASETLAAAVEAAVVFYSRYNPRVVEADLSIVVDQLIYDLPSNFFLMRDLNWWPDGEASVTFPQDALWDRAYRASLLTARATELKPYYEVRNRQLILRVKPTSAETVEYMYYALHEEVSESYTTIPSDDFDVLLKLATAELLDRMGAEAALDPRVAEGLLEIDPTDVPKNLLAMVGHLRRCVKDKYGGY